MTKQVKVSDIGTMTIFEVGENGEIEVLRSGGVPVADILDHKRISSLMDDEVLANRIMDRWRHSYDGDAAENCLSVSVGNAEVYA